MTYSSDDLAWAMEHPNGQIGYPGHELASGDILREEVLHLRGLLTESLNLLRPR